MADETINATNTSIIPALPNWYLMQPITQDHKVIAIHAEPIIGWAISYGSSPETPNGTCDLMYTTTPITTEFNTGCETIILCSPNGKYSEPNIQDCLTEADVIARFQEVEDRWTKLEEQASRKFSKAQAGK